MPGDIIFVDGGTFIDRVIQWATISPWNHCALVGDGHLIEALVDGVANSPLDKYQGRHTFHGRVRAGQSIPDVVAWAEAWVGRKYGWREALTAGTRDVLHVPIRPRIFGHLDCSGLIAAAFASARCPITRAIAPAPSDLWASEVVEEVRLGG